MLAFLALPQHTALALDKVRIGLFSVSAIHGAMWAAEEKGLFKKHGIEPELVIIAVHFSSRQEKRCHRVTTPLYPWTMALWARSR